MKHQMLVVVRVLWLAAQPRCAWAGDWAVPDRATARDQAVVVCAGPVDQIEPLPAPQITIAHPVRVSHVWKGDVPATITIATARSDVSCGYAFQAGHDSVIYARESGTTLSNGSSTVLETGFCSRTRPRAESQDDLAALWRGAGARRSTTANTTATAYKARYICRVDVGGCCGASAYLRE